MSDIKTISPQELHRRRETGETPTLIDVRTPAEFEEVHAVDAKLLPLDRLNPSDFAERDDGQPVYVLCHSGSRAAKACQKLAEAGVEAVSVEGGTRAWDAAGLPVVRGRKSISLERQVRIAAGSLVLLGVILAWLVHPAAIALSAFVGAGLIFAGVTDTCGMGMMLARMPWNQRGTQPAVCPVEQPRDK